MWDQGSRSNLKQSEYTKREKKRSKLTQTKKDKQRRKSKLLVNESKRNGHKYNLYYPGIVGSRIKEHPQAK